jgi:hypothetical protein
MFYLDTQTNTRYYLGRAFSYGNKNYLPSGATHAVFMALGFTQVVIQQRPDDRFYIVSGPDNTGAYSSTARDLAELKTSYIRQAKTTAFQLLKGTDWYIVRQMELGYGEAPVPVDVTSFRAAVRAAVTSRCDAIDATTTVEELEALIKAPSRLYDEEGNDLGANPAALIEYPETPEEVTTYG